VDGRPEVLMQAMARDEWRAFLLEGTRTGIAD
jgi:hypothetical protein